MNRLLGIGITGLRAHQQAIGTTGHNIANANVEGYSRQRVDLTTQSGQKLGAGYTGSGVQVTDIRRLVDEFLVEQLRLDTSHFHSMKIMADHYGELDSLLANSSTGLAPAMQEMFASLQQASQDPTSLEVRQVVLNSAGSLAQRFNSLHSALESQQRGVNRQLDALAGQVTALAEGLAAVNRELTERHPSDGGTGRPNTLLDKRDSLLQELSELVGVQVSTGPGGAANVFMGNGQPLVMGSQANRLLTAPSTTDPGQQELVFSAGEVHQVISPFIKGGSLGGLLDYRRESLEPAFGQLGRIALNLAWDFNEQQRSGLDLDGDPGQNLFADINRPQAMRDRVMGAATNDGNARLEVAITDPGALTTDRYQLHIGSDDQYRLVRLGDGQQVAGGDLADLDGIELDGFTLNLAEGSLQEGDRFVIAPTRTGARDLQQVMQAPEELAFAQPLRGRADAANQGSGSLTVTDWASAEPPVQIKFTSANTFSVLDLSDPENPQPLDGLQDLAFTPDSTTPVTIRDPDSQEVLYRFELGGRPAAGDGFVVEPNALGSSDNRNALAMAELREQAGIGGHQGYESAYGLLVEQVGSRTAELKINRDAADTLVTQARSQRDAVSGVNLDEEAANLIRFEQAYNASAQVINIARTLFDSLLTALR